MFHALVCSWEPSRTGASGLRRAKIMYLIGDVFPLYRSNFCSLAASAARIENYTALASMDEVFGSLKPGVNVDIQRSDGECFCVLWVH